MRFVSLTSRNFKELYREPVSIILGLLMPVGLLVLFVLIGKNAPLKIFTPDMLTPAITIFSFAFLIMFSAVLLSKDRQSAFLLRLLTTPLKPIDFILAYFMPYLPFALLQILACFAVGIILGATYSLLNVVLALVVIFPMALVCVGIGMILGSLLSEGQIAGIGSMLITAIGIFGGIWMELKMIGGIFEGVGYVLPFAHAIDAARSVLAGSGLGNVVTNLYWVYGYAVILFVVGVLSFRCRTTNN